MQKDFRGTEWFSTSFAGTFTLSAAQAALLGTRCPRIPEQDPTINTIPIPMRRGRGILIPAANFNSDSNRFRWLDLWFDMMNGRTFREDDFLV